MSEGGNERSSAYLTCSTCGYEAEDWEDARQHHLNILEHAAEYERSLHADNEQ